MTLSEILLRLQTIRISITLSKFAHLMNDELALVKDLLHSSIHIKR